MDLYTEQGVLQIKASITHLQLKSYVASPLQVLLETYQVTAGIFGCPLHNSTKRLLVHVNWIHSIKDT
jgi:hypothetical protein